jgi:hypothetical protein
VRYFESKRPNRGNSTKSTNSKLVYDSDFDENLLPYEWIVLNNDPYKRRCDQTIVFDSPINIDSIESTFNSSLRPIQIQKKLYLITLHKKYGK